MCFCVLVTAWLLSCCNGHACLLFVVFRCTRFPCGVRTQIVTLAPPSPQKLTLRKRSHHLTSTKSENLLLTRCEHSLKNTHSLSLTHPIWTHHHCAFLIFVVPFFFRILTSHCSRSRDSSFPSYHPLLLLFYNSVFESEIVGFSLSFVQILTSLSFFFIFHCS